MVSPSASKRARPLALITRASSGIGADLARELATNGYDLVLVARREATLRALADELATHQARVTVIDANLAVLGAACRLTSEPERRGLTAVDVLVNNAGFGDYASFECAEPTKLSEMIQLNVLVLTLLTRLLLPSMIARGRGRVLLVEALAGLAPGPGAAVYHATKAFVLNRRPPRLSCTPRRTPDHGARSAQQVAGSMVALGPAPVDSRVGGWGSWLKDRLVAVDGANTNQYARVTLGSRLLCCCSYERDTTSMTLPKGS